MSEISKGPWRVAHDSWHTFDIRGAEGDYIAELMTGVCGESDDSDQDWQWIEQQKANAELIAKAQDMHAALNRIAFRCQSFLADERTMQLESIEAILAICDSALDNSFPENS